jgi:hypothetical protein
MSKKNTIDPLDELVDADIQIAASTDRYVLSVSIVARKAMTPEQFSDLLFYAADKIAEQGEKIYEDGISGHYN